MSNMKLQMLLTAKDKASGVYKNLTDVVKKSNQQIVKNSAATAAKQQAVVQKNSAAYKRATLARSRLGVRSERQIQREIKQTKAAYNRLARSGTASANELSRAYGRMSDKVSRLNRELGITSKRQRGMGRLGKAASVAGGVVAGGTLVGGVITEPARRQRSYDRRAREVTNMAFGESASGSREKGLIEINKIVDGVVRSVGGDKDSVLETLKELLNSGEVTFEQAKTVLPAAQKAAIGQGDNVIDYAKAAIAGMSQLGIKANELSDYFDIMIMSGKAGNFEASDIAKWAPAIFSKKKTLGDTGMQAAKDVFADLQGVRTVSSDSNDAGNNYKNFLAKLTSPELSGKMKKIGIDWDKSLKQRKAKGQTTVEAAKSIFKYVIENNPEYKKLQQEYNKAEGIDKQKKLAEMKSLAGQMEISKVLTDMQAMTGLLGSLADAPITRTKNSQKNAQGISNADYQFIAHSDDFKINQGKNAWQQGLDKPMKWFNSQYAKFFESYSNWAKDNPKINSLVTGGGTVLAAGGTAAAGGVVAKRLITGGAATGSTAAVANGARAAGASALAKSAVGKLASKSNLPLLIASLFAGAANKNVWIPQGLQNRRNNAAYGTAQMNAIMASSKGKKPSIWSQAGALPIAATKQSEWANASGAYAAAAKQRETQIQQFQDMASKTEAGFKQLTAQPINVTTTNQIFIDGAQVSESVSKQQANRMSRGE